MLTTVPVCVVLNMAGGEITARLKIPLYFDSLGTVIAAVLLGPLPAALTGLGTNVVWAYAFQRHTALPFGITAFVIGLAAGYAARAGWMRRPHTAVGAGIATGLVAAVVSAPIAAQVFGGFTGGGTDLLVAFFLQTGANIQQATLGQGIVSDPIDKAITFLAGWAIVRALPDRLIGAGPK
jgi:energy-coupling factor transport system substrate-specific component